MTDGHRSRYFRTVIMVEVLSDSPYAYRSLKDTDYDITHGDCSGMVEMVSQTELTADQMSAALQRQGSDPEFLIEEEASDDDDKGG